MKNKLTNIIFQKKLVDIQINLKRKIRLLLRFFGIDYNTLINIRKMTIFLKNIKQWKSQGGNITYYNPVLTDFSDNAGTASGHYFHQDLIVASYIHKRNPKRHIDVGSRIDGFVAHVASFRKIEIFDIRPLEQSIHRNMIFNQIDLKYCDYKEISDSISCLHAIEHFGLGRYKDEIDIFGHIKGIENLIKMLKKGGILYISFPIGINDEVHFNAHRVFHPKTIPNDKNVIKNLRMINFDYVDDDGNLHIGVNVDSVVGKVRYGCGIFTFEKM